MFHIVLITVVIILFVVDFKQNFDQKSQHKQCILILCIHSSSSLINLNRYANTQWTIQYNNQPHNYTHFWWFSLSSLSVAQTSPLQPTSNKTLWPSWSKAVDSRTWFLLLNYFRGFYYRKMREFESRRCHYLFFAPNYIIGTNFFIDIGVFSPFWFRGSIFNDITMEIIHTLIAMNWFILLLLLDL